MLVYNFRLIILTRLIIQIIVSQCNDKLKIQTIKVINSFHNKYVHVSNTFYNHYIQTNFVRNIIIFYLKLGYYKCTYTDESKEWIHEVSIKRHSVSSQSKIFKIWIRVCFYQITIFVVNCKLTSSMKNRRQQSDKRNIHAFYSLQIQR